MSFTERFAQLNDAQKQAVETIDGPLLVIAGPGSGKTQILSMRVANILQKTDTHPSSILCLTFTDSAAANMRERLAGLIGQDAYRVAIYTFHSFSTDIIGRFPEYFYEGATFSPADALTQIDFLERIFSELAYDSPLRKEHSEQGYTYLNVAKTAITHLKKAGLTADDFETVIRANTKALEYVNEKTDLFEERLSLAQLPAIEQFVSYLFAYDGMSPIHPYESLPRSAARALSEAVEHAKELGKTAPLTEWKKDWIKKDEDGKRVLKDALYLEKQLALAGVYRQYTNRMHAQGYYDFDDMLLDVLAVLKNKNSALRYELQERYQYILVDEFQDTNDAQMRLLEYLTDAEVHEGRPNIMAVGDDDQAIYKFQGAELSNIFQFQKLFREPVLVTLKHNYRSRQNILDLARHIIIKGTERLERRISGLSKEITAATSSAESGTIVSRVFETSAHEYHWVAREIKRLIADGMQPDEIAVIARKHHELHALEPHLAAIEVPVAYERQRDVLQEPHVRQLVQMARFISSLLSIEKNEADHLLPEILSFPFWGLERKVVWELSVEAKANSNSWLKAMLHSTKPELPIIARFFLEAAQRSQYEPAEHVLDMLVGSTAGIEYQSPFKEYYFGKEKLTRKKAEYVSFLSSLQEFVRAFREHKQGQFVKIADLVTFADIHEKNSIPLIDQSPFAGGEKAVRLLSAHKAKGLEFNVVFVLSCQDAVWASAARGSILPFPANISIAPAGDTVDDQLRLFYVALTRARHSLYLTSFAKAQSGREVTRLRFLVPEDGEAVSEGVKKALTYVEADGSDMLDTHEVLAAQFSHLSQAPYIADEKAFLKARLEHYQMSVTHLNNFLDVTKGGPRVFFEQNLLQFPQAKTPASSYGSAVHGAMEQLWSHFKSTKELPPVELFLSWFKTLLKKERLSETDCTALTAQGEKELALFYEVKKEQFHESDLVEVSFKHQGVVVGGAHLTGKLDRIIFTMPNEIEVRDFKTGKVPPEGWDGRDVFEKVKLHQYRRQLIFYKLLVEHSRDFGGKYTVNRGVLEFIKPLRGAIVDLPLEITKDDIQRVEALIGAVYKKIMTLDFPDTDNYPEDINGILAFEDELLQ